MTNKSDRSRSLRSVDRQYTKSAELAACAVEMNLTWKLTGTERLTLYYDSVEEYWGSWHALSVFFPLRAGVTSESSMQLLSGIRHAGQK